MCSHLRGVEVERVVTTNRGAVSGKPMTALIAERDHLARRLRDAEGQAALFRGALERQQPRGAVGPETCPHCNGSIVAREHLGNEVACVDCDLRP
jgi:hypothetical protein